MSEEMAITIAISSDIPTQWDESTTFFSVVLQCPLVPGER